MKNVLRKWASIILCISMTAVLAAGCGNKTTADKEASNAGNAADTSDTAKKTENMTTVNLALLGIYDFSDAPAVQEKINEILAEKYGIQVNITYISSGSWTQQTNLMLTSDEVDVLTLFQTPLSTYVANGQLLALDDYYNNAGDAFKSVWSEDEINGTRVNGTLYSITNLRNFANTYDVMMSKAIVEELGIDTSSINSLESLGDVLYKVHEAHPEIYAMVPQSTSMMSNGWTWDGMGDESYIGVLADCGQSAKVENLFETDDFKEYTANTHKWYKDGLIMADTLSNTESGDQLVLNGKGFCYLSNNSNAAPKEGLIKVNIIPAWAVGNSYAALSYGISANTKHPDESWKLMEAMYTDPEVATLLIDGIEDTHYIVNEDGSISYPEGLDAGSVPYGGADQYWSFPNAGLTPPLKANGASFFEELIAFNKNAVVSKANGFNFDSGSVTDEYSSCINVMDKYYDALLCGAVDPETTIPTAVKELKASGIDKVIAAKQEQLDAFLAGK